MLTRNHADLMDTEEIHDLYPTFKGGVAFDVGASFGVVANILAPNFDEIIACEPSPEPFAELLEKRAVNVTALPYAISDQPGKITLTFREMSVERGYLYTGDTLPEWGKEIGTIEVESRRLDDLSKKYGYPDFVKIDVEGHEIRVLKGGVKTFQGHPEFLIEIHSEENGLEAFAFLEARGMQARVVRHAFHPEGSYRWNNHFWLVSDYKEKR